jgi:hypothetical protein
MRNDKHSPLVDDEVAHRLQGFVQGAPVPTRDDSRLDEELGDLEPGHRPELDDHVAGQPSIADQQRRADFARWLRPSDFPATVAVVTATAIEEGAPEWVLDALSTLDPDAAYDTIGAVYDATSSGAGRS